MDEQKTEILELLDYITSQRRSLQLITNFRAIPLNLVAVITRCSQATGTVRLMVHHHQIVSLNTGDTVLVQSDLFPSVLVGDINQMDMHTAIITLGSLRYVTGSMGNRKNMRVQPESPIHVEVIMGHGYSIQGEMVDISVEGLSIQLAKDHFPQDNLFVLETPVEIRLGLPVSLPVSGKRIIHDFSVQASIAYINESQQTYRVGLLTFIKEPVLGLLRRYIFDRQTEVMNEIQQMNTALLEAV